MDKQNHNHINCVKCDVDSCVHNSGECCCTAKEIKVGPHFASTTNDTVCQTYKKQ